MSYSKKRLREMALGVIEEQKIFFIEDLCAYLPISKTTFYRKFKPESNDWYTLKEAMDNNRVRAKRGMQVKWYKSESAPLQIGLYKLIGTDEDRRKLSQQALDLSSNDGSMVPKIIVNSPQVKDDLDNI